MSRLVNYESLLFVEYYIQRVFKGSLKNNFPLFSTTTRMDGLNRILKGKQNPTPSDEGIERVNDFMKDFYCFFIHEKIQHVRYEENKNSFDEKVTGVDFEKYFLQAQELIPFQLFYELEEFFFRLTGKEPPKETVTSRLKEQSLQDTKIIFDEFNSVYRYGDYYELMEEMYNSHDMSHSRKERVSKKCIAELIDMLSDYFEDFRET